MAPLSILAGFADTKETEGGTSPLTLMLSHALAQTAEGGAELPAPALDRLYLALLSSACADLSARIGMTGKSAADLAAQSDSAVQSLATLVQAISRRMDAGRTGEAQHPPQSVPFDRVEKALAAPQTRPVRSGEQDKTALPAPVQQAVPAPAPPTPAPARVEAVEQPPVPRPNRRKRQAAPAPSNPLAERLNNALGQISALME